MSERDRLRDAGTFVPVAKRKQKPVLVHINTGWDTAEYEQLKQRAAKHGVTLKDFVKQAVRFAIAQMEEK